MTRYVVVTVTNIDIMEATERLEYYVTKYMEDGWTVQGGVQVAGPTNIPVDNGPGQGHEIDPVNGGYHHEKRWVLMQSMIRGDAVE